MWRQALTFAVQRKRPQGSTIAELRKNGSVLGHYGATCGQLDGFDFHKLQAAAAYIMLIDPVFVTGK